MGKLLKHRMAGVVALTAILALGAAAGWWRARVVRQFILGELSESAQRCALAFQPEELHELDGSPADVGTAAYDQVKTRLIQLRLVDPEVRFVYIFRHDPDSGRVLFLADSEPAGAVDESLPGDDYPEAPNSPGLQSILRDGRPSTEGPLADSFGTWVTGYAVIGDSGTDGLQHVLGIDLAEEAWLTNAREAGVATAVSIWLVLGLPLASLVVLRREREQREAIRNLSEAMEQSHSAVMIIDLQQRIEYANAGLCAQTGYTRRELIGRPWKGLQGEEVPAEMRTDMMATAQLGQPWIGEWTNVRKDGSRYPVAGTITPVRQPSGRLSCLVAVLEDLTERKRIETQMREAMERAEAGDRAKGEFLAMMSHEVRTPLNGIIGFTELLTDSPLSPEQREYVEAVRVSADTMLRLTSDILDFARIESGKLKLEPHPEALRDLIEGTLDLMAAPAHAKGIELLHGIDPDVPETVRVDAGRLRQVLVNLVNNAVKFTESGEIEVRVRRCPRSAPDPQGRVTLEFSVRDTGIGIPPDQVSRLFRPFSQLEGGMARRFGGTGLGLAICRTIVQLMDGEISVVSEPRQGSEFTFTIRVPVVDQGHVLAGLTLEGLRLGIVAESPGLRRELVRIAEKAGAVPVTCGLGDLREAAHDLAIMEIPGESPDDWKAPDFPRARLVGVVPLTWASARRKPWRARLATLVNRPLHHRALVETLVACRTVLSQAPADGLPVTLGGPDAPEAEEAVNGTRILVVEDNAVNQRLMQVVITGLGYEWRLAANGNEALAALRERPCDVVLMDLHMPELDGISATRKIRAGEAGEALRNVWIVMLTADTRDEQRREALAAGVNGFLAKPLNRAALLEALREAKAGQDRKSGS